MTIVLIASLLTLVGLLAYSWFWQRKAQCRALGHLWEQIDPPLQRHGRTLAHVGDDLREVEMTWIGDKRCARPGCRAVDWWPT